MKIVIKVARGPDTEYAAWCPALPGCFVHKPTKAAALRGIREAATGYLASLGRALPRKPDRQFRTEEPQINA